MELVFGTILRNFLTPFDESVRSVCDALVQSSIDVYRTLVSDLRPTPAKSHYQFNIRDLSKLFQGLLMVDRRKVVILSLTLLIRSRVFTKWIDMFVFCHRRSLHAKG